MLTPQATSPVMPDPDPAEDTINPENDVDEASYESFPASDPPSYSGGAATPQEDTPAEDDNDT